VVPAVPARRPGSPLPGSPAEVGNRFVGRMVDGLVLALVFVPLLVTGVLPPEGAGAALAIGLTGYVYAAVLDATGGTLGKRLLRMVVVDGGGGPPGLGAGATRNLWLLTSLLPGLLGQSVAVAVSVVLASTIANHPADRGWHDRVAGTAVRRLA
jgi:uncharacterized RDD family membrane protein YckC